MTTLYRGPSRVSAPGSTEPRLDAERGRRGRRPNPTWVASVPGNTPRATLRRGDRGGHPSVCTRLAAPGPIRQQDRRAERVQLSSVMHRNAVRGAGPGEGPGPHAAGDHPVVVAAPSSRTPGSGSPTPGVEHQVRTPPPPFGVRVDAAGGHVHRVNHEELSLIHISE